MTRRPCTGLAELRSAFVDDALDDADRERVLAHLVSCSSCRLEVAELRQVRQLLRTRSQTTAPYDLSHRLVSIAGADSHAPLWVRPFRRTRSAGLPSGRRTVRLRGAAAVVALGTLVATAGGIGYAAAPSTTLTAVADPSVEARTAFTAAMADLPLNDDAVSAVMMAPSASLRVPNGAMVAASAPRAESSDAADPAAVLRRAVEAADTVTYRGTASVTARAGADTIAASVEVAQTEQGREVDVYDRRHRTVRTDFAPEPAVPRISADDDVLALLIDGYTLSAWASTPVAGRPATVVEARSGGSASDPPVRVARWWVDDITGLLLWQESYGADGTLLLSAGYTSLTLDPDGFLSHLAPRLGAPSTTASLTLSSASSLTADGWACDDDLAGLSLVRVRSAEGVDPAVLHLLYSDGLHAVSVFEQRGALTAAPVDSSFDSGLGAYLRQDSAAQATWQSGGTVFTVVTDGSTDVLRRAVAALPHDRPRSRTTMERVQAGWARILHSLIG